MILYIKKFIIVQNLSQVKLGTKAQKKANKIIILFAFFWAFVPNFTCDRFCTIINFLIYNIIKQKLKIFLKYTEKE